MPETQDCVSTTVRQQGVFDYDAVIDTIRGWMKSHLYGYFEKKQNYSSGRRSVSIEGDKKIDEYSKYAIEISIAAENLKDIEVVKDKEKVTKQQGNITVKIKSKLTLDHVKRYEDDFWKKVQKWLHRTLLSQKVSEAEDGLNSEVVELTRAVRDTLEFET